MRRSLVVLAMIGAFLHACGGDGGLNAASDTTTPPSQIGTTDPPKAAETTANSEATEAVDTTEGDEAIPGIGAPCDMVDPETVEDAFSFFDASVDRGIEGYAQNCTYWLDTESVPKIDVFHLGTADQWDRIRSGWEETGGGIVEVDGLGDAAYHPTVYHGENDLVFMIGDHVFSIVAWGGSTDETILTEMGEAVKALAQAIVARHG